jgi:NAD(P)-dependent dehydrogenase (short-subunit alcohol dehydrogenase family)
MENKVIVITGGASGMGLETAKLLAGKGAKVSIADVQEGPLKQAVEDIEKAGGKAIGTVVDVRKRDQVEAWIKKTVDTYGKLDGAANLGEFVGRLLENKSNQFVAGVIGKQVHVYQLSLQITLTNARTRITWLE